MALAMAFAKKLLALFVCGNAEDSQRAAVARHVHRIQPINFQLPTSNFQLPTELRREPCALGRVPAGFGLQVGSWLLVGDWELERGS